MFKEATNHALVSARNRQEHHGDRRQKYKISECSSAPNHVPLRCDGVDMAEEPALASAGRYRP